jgi:hypothetical protein
MRCIAAPVRGRRGAPGQFCDTVAPHRDAGWPLAAWAAGVRACGRRAGARPARPRSRAPVRGRGQSRPVAAAVAIELASRPGRERVHASEKSPARSMRVRRGPRPARATHGATRRGRPRSSGLPATSRRSPGDLPATSRRRPGEVPATSRRSPGEVPARRGRCSPGRACTRRDRRVRARAGAARAQCENGSPGACIDNYVEKNIKKTSQEDDIDHKSLIHEPRRNEDEADQISTPRPAAMRGAAGNEPIPASPAGLRAAFQRARA